MSEQIVSEALINAWVGRTDIATDVIAAEPVRRMCATFDRDSDWVADGAPLPFNWHWMYCVHSERPGRLGRDGHPEKGGNLPPIPLPRRMFAGARARLFSPLQIGERVTRRTTIDRIEAKTGRSGPLAFVTATLDLLVGDEVRYREEQDIVYREDPTGDAPPPPAPTPPEGAQIGRRITPDPVLLFRYSALTFNGHRIHYDRSYCTDVEGYPGLVVHGPLIATFLSDLATEVFGDRPLDRFSFRAISPIFDTGPFEIAAKWRDDGLLLWAENNDGGLAMRAEAHGA